MTGLAVVGVLAGAFLLAACARAKEAVAPPLMAAESTVTILEREDDPLPDEIREFVPPAEGYHRALERLPDVAADLDRYLSRNGSDGRALLARARLLRQQYRLVHWNKTGVEEPPDDVDPRDEIFALLDRALAADSALVDAYYAKALNLVVAPDPLTLPRFQEALPNARRAHRADPADTLRIQLLERCLLGVGEDLEAERLRDPGASAGGKESPVALVLQRRSMVPEPPGAVPFPAGREDLGLMVKKRPQDPTLASRYARFRIYQTDSVSMDSLMSFYRARWPGISWHDERSGKKEGLEVYVNPVTRFALAVLRWDEGGGWIPAPLAGNPFETRDVLVLTIEEVDLEELRAEFDLPDSLSDQRLPSSRKITIRDRLGEEL